METKIMHVIYQYFEIIKLLGMDLKTKLSFSIKYTVQTDTRGIQYFCPFAFKARSTKLVLVVCITFRHTSLLDDVHKVLSVFTGH